MVDKFTKIKTEGGYIYYNELLKEVLSNIDISSILSYITTNEKRQIEQDKLINDKASKDEFGYVEFQEVKKEFRGHKHTTDDITDLSIYDRDQINQLVYELREDFLERLGKLPDSIKSDIKAQIESFDSKFVDLEEKIKSAPTEKGEKQVFYVGDSQQSKKLKELKKENQQIIDTITQLVSQQIDYEEMQNDIIDRLTKIKQGDGEERFRQVNIVGGSTATNKLKLLLDVDVENVTDGQVIAWDEASKKWLPTDAGGGGNDTLQDVTDRGATTTNTVTVSPSGNNDGLVANGSGSGSAINITHSGSGNFIESNFFNVDRNGNCEANSFVTTGGADTQVVAGDGSLLNVADIGGGGSLYYRAFNQSVTNTTTATDLIGFDISGGDLGTNKILCLDVEGYVRNTTGVSANFILSVNLGSTTIFSDTSQNFSSDISDDYQFTMSLMLANTNSASAQVMGGSIRINLNRDDGTGRGQIGTDEILVSGLMGDKGGVTEDTTTDKAFSVKVQPSVANANFIINASIIKAEIK